ncbi:MAG: hypothetical protein US20_C0005G0025 [Candidatus Pacebacteria bacterium GW2011_GWF1_36_5]|nr:MAG: hypothetical protein US20_C0005G0025 [Candidatus Pacebacteria bacterium GW2011_GWF1_36_5]
MGIDFNDNEFTKIVITVQEKMIKEDLKTFNFTYKNQNYKAERRIRQIYDFNITEADPLTPPVQEG